MPEKPPGGCRWLLQTLYYSISGSLNQHLLCLLLDSVLLLAHVFYVYWTNRLVSYMPRKTQVGRNGRKRRYVQKGKLCFLRASDLDKFWGNQFGSYHLVYLEEIVASDVLDSIEITLGPISFKLVHIQWKGKLIPAWLHIDWCKNSSHSDSTAAPSTVLIQEMWIVYKMIDVRGIFPRSTVCGLKKYWFKRTLLIKGAILHCISYEQRIPGGLSWGSTNF
jgi:hypothetical protein